MMANMWRYCSPAPCDCQHFHRTNARELRLDRHSTHWCDAGRTEEGGDVALPDDVQRRYLVQVEAGALPH